MRVGMRVDMCIGVCGDVGVDMRIYQCVDTLMAIFAGIYVGMWHSLICGV